MCHGDGDQFGGADGKYAGGGFFGHRGNFDRAGHAFGTADRQGRADDAKGNQPCAFRVAESGERAAGTGRQHKQQQCSTCDGSGALLRQRHRYLWLHRGGYDGGPFYLTGEIDSGFCHGADLCLYAGDCRFADRCAAVSHFHGALSAGGGNLSAVHAGYD